MNTKNKYKVGMYIRVSTEEQAENPEGSIKNQEHRLRDYIKQKNADGVFGDLIEVYCDPGVSAKNMNRPALQKMLSAIRAKEINLVLVTEISRLSRSMRDFTMLWDFMKEHDCKFQSLRDNFDTTSPAGEMIIFTLANFAQFERRQLGERISNAFQARAKRGLWNGGNLPLGFKVDPEKPGHLQTVATDVELVHTIFKTFLEQESLSRTGLALNELGIKIPKRMAFNKERRYEHFTVDFLYRLLTNRAYIGKRVFSTKDGLKEVEASWPAIIDEVQFKRVQELLKDNFKKRKKPPSPNRYPYLLSGLVICKTCGDRLCGKSAHGNGGKVGYYEHTWATKTQSCLSKKVFTCAPHRIPAKRIEPVVWESVKRLLFDEEYSRLLFTEAQALAERVSKPKEVEKLQAKIKSIESQIESTTGRITELPDGISAKLFYDQILKLQKIKEELVTKLSIFAGNDISFELPIDTKDFEAFTAGLKELAANTADPDIQASICRKLIQKIEVSPNGIAIHYFVGGIHFNKIFGDLKMVGSEANNAAKIAAKPLQKYKNARLNDASFYFNVNGSNTLTNGREYRARTDDIHLVRVALYQLS